MDLTQGTHHQKAGRAKKMMLWFGIISMAMMFAGLTSAYVVSKNRPDWISDLQLPNAFYWSTLLIFVSSVTIFLAEKAGLEGTVGGAFGAFGWSGEAPDRIFNTMKNIFKMNMVAGPLRLKASSLGGGTQMAQSYGREIAEKL